jgi:hypothetical protein
MAEDTVTAEHWEYSDYTQIKEDNQLARHNKNNEINQLAMQYTNTEAERDQMVLEGNTKKADELAALLEELTKKRALAERDYATLSHKFSIKNNPKAMRVGGAVIQKNNAKMDECTNRYQKAEVKLKQRIARVYQSVVELGLIEKEAKTIQAQTSDIMGDTGLNGWVSTPGARKVTINKNRKSGIIFIPEQEIIERYLYPDRFKEEIDE